VNHLDIAPRYGMAEDLIGPLVPVVRDRLFVACKSTRRNGDGLRAQLEQSLTKLGCDSVDLHQLHAVTSLDELDAREGALRALFTAREEGLCRFAGITGHDLTAPAAHAEALRRYDLDTVMFPVNARLWGDVDYRRDAEALLDLCAARDVGVMAIKAVAARPWADGRPIGEVGDRSATTWYEPYHEPIAVARGVRFTLSVEGVHAFCTPGDERVLAEALRATEAFAPMDDDEKLEAIEAVSSEPLIFPMPV
jgi:aryl-alcohol dehydrogenase-like predicted oxidoreductase